MKRWLMILVLSGLCLGLKAQDAHRIILPSDTMKTAPKDTASVVLSHQDSVRLYWKPDALRAVWMGAIIPGYGQIYNRSYWKLPIVYGAFFGCAYAVTWTQGMYTDYKTAYRDILTDGSNGTLSDDESKSYIAIIPEGYNITSLGGYSNWTNILKNRQNTYRRYRDLSIVAAIAVYALSLVDAYVDAQLFDYDISDDLSLQLDPTLYHDPYGTSGELHLALRF